MNVLVGSDRVPEFSFDGDAVGPFFAAVAGDVHGQFQAAPNPKLVKGAAQVVLDHLLGGADNLADLAVGHALPDEDCNLYFFGGEALAGGHECASSRLNMAMASLTRLRPSRIPARKKRVSRCCFTVRGLMLS